MRVKSICFVCSGNVFRSASAEKLLRKELLEKGIKGIKVFSLGIAQRRKAIVPLLVKKIVAKKGARDIHQHRAKWFVNELEELSKAGLILTMTKTQADYFKELLEYSYPKKEYEKIISKVYWINEWVAEKGTKPSEGIFDMPHGFKDKDVEKRIEEIHEAVKKIAEKCA